MDQLRGALETSSTVQIELTLMQISNTADRLDVKNPFRAKALSESAAAVLKLAGTKKKTDGEDRVLPSAEKMMRKALDAREHAVGTTVLADTSKLSLELYHLREYEREVDILAAYYAAIGETKKQEELLVRALATSERVLGKQHPALAGPLRRLGDFYFRAGGKDRVRQAASEGGAQANDDGGLDKAIALCRREVEIYESAFGSDDQILHSSVARLGDLLWMKGDEQAAKACDARVAKLQEADSDSKTPEQTMLREVKEHRAFLRFEDAEDEIETFHKMHPDKSS
jgi:tetratricopeptide (TPR) repeat protein